MQFSICSYLSHSPPTPFYFLYLQFVVSIVQYQEPGVAQWLKRCATSRTVPGSIPGNVTGFFSDIFPSDRTMPLGSTQPPVKMSTRNIPGVKGGGCVRLATSPPSCAECHENLGAATSWNPLGHAGPVTGLLYLYLWCNITQVQCQYRKLLGICTCLIVMNIQGFYLQP